MRRMRTAAWILSLALCTSGLSFAEPEQAASTPAEIAANQPVEIEASTEENSNMSQEGAEQADEERKAPVKEQEKAGMEQSEAISGKEDAPQMLTAASSEAITPLSDLKVFTVVESISVDPNSTENEYVVAGLLDNWVGVKNLKVMLNGREMTNGNRYLLKEGQYALSGGVQSKIFMRIQDLSQTAENRIELSADGYQTASYTLTVKAAPLKSVEPVVKRSNITATKTLEIFLKEDTASDIAHEYLTKSKLKIFVNDVEIPTSAFSVDSYRKKITILPSAPWAQGDCTVRVERAGYETKEAIFSVSKISRVDVVSSTTPSPSNETEFKTSYKKGEQIYYNLLAVDIHFENGKVSKQVTFKALQDAWNISITPKDGAKAVEDKVVLTIDGFEKVIPLEIIAKRFELKTAWVKKDEKLVIGFDQEDSGYQLEINNLVIKAGTDKNDLKQIDKMGWRPSSDKVEYRFDNTNKTIEIINLSKAEGRVFVEISSDMYDSVQFEAMVAQDEPTEFLNIQAHKKLLAEEIAAAEKVDLTNKTQESAENLKNILAAAKELLNAEDVSEIQLLSAIENIHVALEHLKDKPAGGNSNQGGTNGGNTGGNTPPSGTASGAATSPRASVRPDPAGARSESIESPTTPLASTPASASVSRAAGIARIAKYFEDVARETGGAFTDVDKNSETMAALHKLIDKKIIVGTGFGKFEPDRAMTRQEFAAILHRLALYLKKELADTAVYTPSDEASWAKESVAFAVSKGLLSNQGERFGAKEPIRRDEMEKALKMLFE